jgi:hypothetical protein
MKLQHVSLLVITTSLLASCGNNQAPVDQTSLIPAVSSIPLSQVAGVPLTNEVTLLDKSVTVAAPNFGSSPRKNLISSQALLPSTNATPTPALGNAFEGLNIQQSGGYYPPDTTGEVGPNHFVQSTNIAVQVYDKATGAPLFPLAKSLNSFFASIPACANGSGDPIVVYDHMVNRWLITQMRFAGGAGPKKVRNQPIKVQLGNVVAPQAVVSPTDPTDLTTAYECIAISKTADPTGDYWQYALPIPGPFNITANDYPKIGLWRDGYYMTFNMFEPGFNGVVLAAVNKNLMLSGLPTSFVTKRLPALNPDNTYNWSIVPTNVAAGGYTQTNSKGLVSQIPPINSPYPFLMDASIDNLNFSSDRIRMFMAKVTWLPYATAKMDLTIQDLAVEPLEEDACGWDNHCIPQKGTAATLDTLMGRMMMNAQMRRILDTKTGKVTNTIVVSQPVGSDSDNIVRTRWYELRGDAAGAVWNINQQNNFNAYDNTNTVLHTWMSHMTIDKSGGIGLGYSTSSATQFPSIGYTYRSADTTLDPLGSMRKGGVLKAGSSSQTRLDPPRWGDYSNMSVDPVDGCTIWYTNEYYGVAAIPQRPVDWKTAFGFFKPDGCE